MSQREFFNAIEGAREVREFEAEQSWKQTQKIVSLLAITYISQFPEKSQGKARKNIETILTDDTKKKEINRYTLDDISQLEAETLKIERLMNKHIQQQENGVSGS